jgi:TRAP-type C4-dicarboxylate transport system substrate-binding protein
VIEQSVERLAEILQAMAAVAEKRGWEMSRKREGDANKLLADNGMTVHAPDAALMASMNKIGDTITAEWLKAAGADGEAIVKAYKGK